MSVLERTDNDGIVTLTLNRPNSLNAFDGPLIHRTLETVESLAEDDAARCVVIEGAGRAFSAGGDVNRMQNRMEEDMPAGEFKDQLRYGAQEMIAQLYTLSTPTIAKVDGVTSGMGCSLALACDLLYAAEGSTFGLSFRNVALGPDTGISYLLPRRVGTHRALELAYSGEPIDAERAAEINLVNEVLPADELEERVGSLARSIADGPALALEAANRLIKAGVDRPLTEAIEAETVSQAFLYATDDHQEGVMAFLDRREPEFSGQ